MIQLGIVDVEAEIVGVLVEGDDLLLRVGVHEPEQGALDLLEAAVALALENHLDGEQDAIFGQEGFDLEAGTEVSRFVDGPEGGRFISVEVLGEVLVNDFPKFLLHL